MKAPKTEFQQITPEAVIEVFTKDERDPYSSNNDIDKLNRRIEGLERLLCEMLETHGPGFMLKIYVGRHGSDSHYNDWMDIKFVAEKPE